MKVKMIVALLLFMGNAQMFAKAVRLTKPIPSMKPSEIAQLKYADLTPEDQKSLWFTAMFTGLGTNRKTARQVISKEFPKVNWSSIEQIALSAKQSNKIDEGIVQAQATVGITQTPVAPTVPSKTPTIVGGGSQVPEPVVEQTPSKFTPAVKPSGPQLNEQQKIELEGYIAKLEQLQRDIVKLDPNYSTIRYSFGEVMERIKEHSFDDVERDMSKEIEKLNSTLSDLKKMEQKLNNYSSEVENLFKKIGQIDPNYDIPIYESNIKNYNDFRQMVDEQIAKIGVQAYRAAEYVRDALMSLRKKKEEQSAQKVVAWTADQNTRFVNQVSEYGRLVEEATKKGKIAGVNFVGLQEKLRNMPFDDAMKSLQEEMIKVQQELKEEAKPADLPKELADRYIDLAREMDKQLEKAREYDPVYKRNVSYVDQAHDMLTNQKYDAKKKEETIKDDIQNWKNEHYNRIAEINRMQQLRNEYDKLLKTVQKEIEELKKGGKEAPQHADFDQILNDQGLNAARAELNTYVAKLKK